MLVDADNTLWDTDGVFAAAQLNLLAAVEALSGRLPDGAVDRLSFIREIDQTLAEEHHLGLRYPVRLLVAAVVHALAGVSADEAARRAWREAAPLDTETTEAIEQSFKRDLARMPDLLPGVREGLARLRDAGCTIAVVTEGSRERVLGVIEALGLGSFVERVIEGQKTRGLYERLLRAARTSSAAYMIGDQLGRDIEPANAAGLTTVYVPGRFRPRWETQASSVEPSISAVDFSDAADAVLKRG